jgi:hypothetical protein
MRKRLWIAAVAMSAMGAGAVCAADIADLERQLEQARKEAPITVEPFLAVSEPVPYFGGYKQRKDTVYKRGEEMLFYAEPKNLIYPKNSQGVYKPAFDVDLEVTGPDGKTFKKPKFASLKLDTRSKLQDLYLNLNVSLSQAPAGVYKVKFVIRDLNSPKTATFGKDVTLK